MCGICGVVQFDRAPISEDLLRSMAASLAHRGLDGEGTFFSPSVQSSSGPTVALGHRRLAIIDLSANANQPMTNEDGTLWIVFNGEIYNFRELRQRLLAQGHTFRSDSDTEVVLHLYEELGERCVEELDGMFAFALWDMPRKRLFLARDRVGKKPLYYVKTRRAFVFGSEVKAVLQHPSVSVEPNPAAFPHYFTFGYPPAGVTFYKDVAQLAPAHTLTVGADGHIESRCYWRWNCTLAPGPPPSLTEARARVRELVTDAVRKRLIADVPLGAFLSGGIDSSIVVGIMSRLLDRPVKTFSIGFAGDPGFDETHYARIVASHFRTDHTEFIVEPKAVDLIEPLVWHHDGPFGDSSAIPTYIVAQLTRQHVTVALNGDGGDELFAGYLRFNASLAAERLPAGFVRFGNRALSIITEPQQHHHWLRRAQRFFDGAARPLLGRVRRWVTVFDDDLQRLLRPEVCGVVPLTGLDYPGQVIAETQGLSSLSKILYVNFSTYLPEDLLVKADRTTMAHGLEGRSPFLDHRLAEYVAGLPDSYKLRLGTTKYILKRAFADMLPPAILKRGKMGFGVPVGTWFRGALREYITDLLLASEAKSREYLVPSYVATLLSEHVEGKRNHANRLWALLAFEVWLRMVHGQAWNQPRKPFAIPTSVG